MAWPGVVTVKGRRMQSGRKYFHFTKIAPPVFPIDAPSSRRTPAGAGNDGRQPPGMPPGAEPYSNSAAGQCRQQKGHDRGLTRGPDNATPRCREWTPQHQLVASRQCSHHSKEERHGRFKRQTLRFERAVHGRPRSEWWIGRASGGSEQPGLRIDGPGAAARDREQGRTRRAPEGNGPPVERRRGTRSWPQGRHVGEPRP